MAEVRDWPALAYRGFMMDLSHGQLLRVSEIERQLDLLARYKANQYYFYSEASIAYQGYEAVNPGPARYTREEVRQVLDYARQRHLDVVPCMELHGHMHDLFRVEKFAALGLPRYGDELCPRNPRLLPVLDDWVAQTARLVPSPVPCRVRRALVAGQAWDRAGARTRDAVECVLAQAKEGGSPSTCIWG